MRPGIPQRSWPIPPASRPFNEAQAMRPGIQGIVLLCSHSAPFPSMRPRPCGPGYTDFVLAGEISVDFLQ